MKDFVLGVVGLLLITEAGKLIERYPGFWDWWSLLEIGLMFVGYEILLITKKD